MDNIFEAIVEKDGRIRIKSPVHLKKGSKVLVSVPSDEPDSAISGVVLSEKTLAADWLNSEEDAAWAHLQQEMSEWEALCFVRSQAGPTRIDWRFLFWKVILPLADSSV